MESPTIVKEETPINNEEFIKIFPNLTKGKVSIKLEGYQDMRIESVYNVFWGF